MAKRKALSAKIRFEVFKRDSFTCQYCGKSAPDVILNADHIVPVASGGSNGIMNLITSCFPCNSGKGAREISDDSVLKKQTDQLRILSERKSQIEMMAKWRSELQKVGEMELLEVERAINRHIERGGKVLTDSFLRSDIQACLKKYGIQETLDSVEKSAYQYLKDPSSQEHRTKFYAMIPRICYWSKREKQNPVESDLRRLSYVANKYWCRCDPKTFQHRLIELNRKGLSSDELFSFIKRSTGIMSFEDKVREFQEGRN